MDIAHAHTATQKQHRSWLSRTALCTSSFPASRIPAQTRGKRRELYPIQTTTLSRASVEHSSNWFKCIACSGTITQLVEHLSSTRRTGLMNAWCMFECLMNACLSMTNTCNIKHVWHCKYSSSLLDERSWSHLVKPARSCKRGSSNIANVQRNHWSTSLSDFRYRHHQTVIISHCPLSFVGIIFRRKVEKEKEIPVGLVLFKHSTFLLSLSLL